MWVLVIVIVAVFFWALIGGLCTPSLRPGKPYVHTNWAGVATVALAGLLLFDCLSPLPLLVDPTYVLVQQLLFAGVVGVVVDVPMMVYRNYHARVPPRRTAWEVAALVVLVQPG